MPERSGYQANTPGVQLVPDATFRPADPPPRRPAAPLPRFDPLTRCPAYFLNKYASFTKNPSFWRSRFAKSKELSVVIVDPYPKNATVPGEGS